MRVSHAVLRRFYQALTMAVGLALAGVMYGQTYYVSSINQMASDSNTGTSLNAPWRTLNKVDSTTFAPGSQILFQDGSNWYGQQLIASSSGTTAAPITYGNYGPGADPTFWGSIPLNNSGFQPVAGSSGTYFMPTTTVDSTWANYSPTVNTSAPVTSVFNNHQFLNSATLATGQTTDSANISYVESNPNSWYYTSAATTPGLYINTGAALNTSTAITATVVGGQDPGNPSGGGVVYNNGKSNVTFQNMTVQESAAFNSGYAFSAAGGSSVTFLNDTASGAGKHDFAAINTTNFLGQGLNSSYSMPGQGYGGASAYVSYADYTVSNTTYQWINDTSTNPNGPYQPFYTHEVASTTDSTPIASVLVQNMNSSGGPGIATSSTGNETITITGGTDNGGAMVLYSNNTIVNGMLLTGTGASIQLVGSNNVIQNTIIDGSAPNSSQGGAIIDDGTNNVIRYNTIVLGQAVGNSGGAIALQTNTTNTQIYANIIDTPFAAFFQFQTGTPEITAFDNLFANTYGTTNNPQVIYFVNSSPNMAITNWPITISYNELFGNPDFVNAAAGNFALLPGSIAAYVFDPTTGEYVLYDYYGNPRPGPGSFDSLGAIEVPEPGAAWLLLGLSIALLAVSLRYRCPRLAVR